MQLPGVVHTDIILIFYGIESPLSHLDFFLILWSISYLWSFNPQVDLKVANRYLDRPFLSLVHLVHKTLRWKFPFASSGLLDPSLYIRNCSSPQFPSLSMPSCTNQKSPCFPRIKIQAASRRIGKVSWPRTRSEEFKRWNLTRTRKSTDVDDKPIERIRRISGGSVLSMNPIDKEPVTTKNHC